MVWLLWTAIGIALGVGLVAAALGYGFDVLAGVVAPALTTAASWLSIARLWAEAPERSLDGMVRGFVVKCLFFVAWVTIVVQGLGIKSIPFVASLVVSFLVLHVIQAWCLKRLMQT